MSVREVFRKVDNSTGADTVAFRWIDVVDPTSQELDDLAAAYRLPVSALVDCLQPEHLPKAEILDGVLFVILRAYDDQAPADAGNINEMTRKVAIFLTERELVVVHRTELAFLKEFESRCVAKLSRVQLPLDRAQKQPLVGVFLDILRGAVSSYNRPLESAEDVLDGFEELLFNNRIEAGALKEMLPLKRRVRLMKRIMRLTGEVFVSLLEKLKARELLWPGGSTGASARHLVDIRESTESLYAHAEELQEDIDSAVDIQISLSSQRTNEIVRVLTVFSVFFMPLTFIVGVYGMNFEYMPELRSEWGYPGVWVAMIGVTIVIFAWFRKRRWL